MFSEFIKEFMQLLINSLISDYFIIIL